MNTNIPEAVKQLTALSESLAKDREALEKNTNRSDEQNGQRAIIGLCRSEISNLTRNLNGLAPKTPAASEPKK